MRELLKAILLFIVLVALSAMTIEILLCMFSDVPGQILSNIQKEQSHVVLGTRG